MEIVKHDWRELPDDLDLSFVLFGRGLPNDWRVRWDGDGFVVPRSKDNGDVWSCFVYRDQDGTRHEYRLPQWIVQLIKAAERDVRADVKAALVKALDL